MPQVYQWLSGYLCHGYLPGSGQPLHPTWVKKKKVLGSAAIWVCATCETCTTRCPNEIDIAGVMDFLKQTVVQEKTKAEENKVLVFHQAFLDDIRKRGRVFETGLMQNYMFKSGEWIRKLKDRTIVDEMRLGWTMVRKGRLNLLPKHIKGRREIKKLFSISSANRKAHDSR